MIYVLPRNNLHKTSTTYEPRQLHQNLQNCLRREYFTYTRNTPRLKNTTTKAIDLTRGLCCPCLLWFGYGHEVINRLVLDVAIVVQPALRIPSVEVRD